MDWSEADVANGIAALLNGFRQGSAEARAAALEQRKMGIDESQLAMKNAMDQREMGLKEKEQSTQSNYYDALAEKARRENMLSPESSQYVADTLGIPGYTSGKQFTTAEVNPMVDLYGKKDDLAWRMRLMREQKEKEKLQDRKDKNVEKYYVERDKYLTTQIVKAKGQYASLMNDPEKAMGMLTTIEELEKERKENRDNAMQRGIEVFQMPEESSPFPASESTPPAVTAPVYTTPTAKPGFNWGNVLKQSMPW